MRAWSLISVLLVCASCTVRIPKPGELRLAVKTTMRVEARVEPPAPVVAIQGAPVAEFFGIPLEGTQDVVFVLDCSGSMSLQAQGRLAQIQPTPASAPGGAVVTPPADGTPPPPPQDPNATDPNAPAAPTVPRKIEVAQAELVDALQRLPAGTRMNVIFFNSEVEAFAPSMIVLDETGRTNLVSYVQETAPAGSTALAPAMRIAFLMNARRVVLLSDGLGNVGGNAASVLRDAREAMRGGVRIDTIGLGAGQAAELLGTLASESGGLYQAL